MITNQILRLYSIRVKSGDENASLVDIFSVALLDYNEGVSPATGRWLG